MAPVVKNKGGFHNRRPSFISTRRGLENLIEDKSPQSSLTRKGTFKDVSKTPMQPNKDS